MKPTILIPKVAHNKTDSFFYRSQQDIAELKAKDGANFVVFPCGKVDMLIKGRTYCREERFGTDGFDDLTNKDINSDETKLTNNNWFEVIGFKNGKQVYHGDGDVAFDYDDGIGLLKDVVAQYEVDLK